MNRTKDPEVEKVLKRLDQLNPYNLHLLTDAGIGLRMDFESVWSKHGPQAARYLMLPYVWNNKIKITLPEDAPTAEPSSIK